VRQGMETGFFCSLKEGGDEGTKIPINTRERGRNVGVVNREKTLTGVENVRDMHPLKKKRLSKTAKKESSRKKKKKEWRIRVIPRQRETLSGGWTKRNLKTEGWGKQARHKKEEQQTSKN